MKDENLRPFISFGIGIPRSGKMEKRIGERRSFRLLSGNADKHRDLIHVP